MYFIKDEKYIALHLLLETFSVLSNTILNYYLFNEQKKEAQKRKENKS